MAIPVTATMMESLHKFKAPRYPFGVVIKDRKKPLKNRNNKFSTSSDFQVVPRKRTYSPKHYS
ncbi:hypothetical protein PIB30_020201 [Stylosanthes scabra]|uniref:Uncharacterized protein n=1 Tax=Stylosanthes scabra TaxID=79078 RepID=A0ABU6R8R3_9FABA|nr:hypothetical protein [Stylosanthes scabra]